MKYYELQFSIERHIMGDKTSIHQGQPLSHYKEFDSPGNYSNYEPLAYTNKLVFYIRPEAKLTDLVSLALMKSKYLLMSEKLMKIIMSHQASNVSLHKAKVHHRGIEYDYYFLHFVWNKFDDIDLGRSKFYFKRNILLPKNEGEAFISSYEDYRKQEEERRLHIHAETIYMKEQFKDDIFGIPEICFAYFFISETLKNCLIENEITGVEITPQKYVVEKTK